MAPPPGGHVFLDIIMNFRNLQESHLRTIPAKYHLNLAKCTMTNVYNGLHVSPLFQVIYCVKFHWNASICFWVNLLNMTVTFLKSLSVQHKCLNFKSTDWFTLVLLFVNVRYLYWHKWFLTISSTSYFQTFISFLFLDKNKFSIKGAYL